MYKIPDFSTGGPSSSYEMIILRTNSHGGIIRVCIIIFTTALRKKKYVKFSKKKTSPFQRTSEKPKAEKLHFPTPDLRSEKFQRKMTGQPQIQRRIQAHIL